MQVLQFVIYGPLDCQSNKPDEVTCSRVRAILERETREYLFEDGFWNLANPVIYYDSCKIVGILNCRDNVENAWFLVRALHILSVELPSAIIRLVNTAEGADFLWSETNDMNVVGGEDQVEDNGFVVLHGGKLACFPIQTVNELSAVRMCRKSPKQVKYDEKRLENVLKRIENRETHTLISHSMHIVCLALPETLARAIHSCTDDTVRKLVPRAALISAQESFMDAQIGKVLDDICGTGGNLVKCMVRFTRLSYASLHAQCLKINKKDIGEALVEGFARLICTNDEFESKYGRYRQVLERKGYFQIALTPVGLEELDHRAREKVFLSRGEDEPWITSQNLRGLILRGDHGRNDPVFDIRADDPNDWLYNDDVNKDDLDNGQVWDEVAKEMKGFLEKYEKEETASSSGGVASGNIAASRPVTFSSKQFFRILGGGDNEGEEDDFCTSSDDEDEEEEAKMLHSLANTQMGE